MSIENTEVVDESEHRTIELSVNGDTHQVRVKPNELLLNVLREKLHLTGSKYACGTGECRACSVLVDGEPTLSCLQLAITAEGKEITTVEGISDGRTLHEIQQSFLDTGASQCGYCTPGFVVMTKKLLEDNPSPTEEEIRDHLKGNICRCTGYNNIIDAVKKAAEETEAE
ncbi:(2Fe-2S)-binding protein [Natrarchaeobius halalkaliphilus]|uniref:(2Fe-2S)-binding protein n=1 Tax=Natrarchaeobius halalkaliphilus TaxID=1679091 RepID=A0A3N6LJ36_9EURY|nr:(2Fe-2S)-binding protein [Natrarchaeobius halalkaliphilus]RQG88066.1 (2Fe-2S)-binding protein [Natrarchaeobius halalkaliphilus]